MNNLWFIGVVIAAEPIGLVIWWFIDREYTLHEEELGLTRRLDAVKNKAAAARLQ